MGRLSDRLNQSGGITDLENETIDASIEHQIHKGTQEVAMSNPKSAELLTKLGSQHIRDRHQGVPQPLAKDISETLPTVASSAMVVHIEITKWGGKVKDHAATEKVLTQVGASYGAGVFKKSLMPHSKELKQIETLSNTLRTRNMARCLPWIGNGMGLLPTTEFDWFNEESKKCKREYYDAVDKFIKNYNKACEQAKEDLGDLFDPSLYDTAEHVRSKFTYRVNRLGIEDGNQPAFYKTLTEAQIETCRADIQKQNDIYVPALTEACWDKISAPLVKLQMDALHEHLYVDTQKKLKFQQTKVTNVTKAVEAVRSLNVMNDADLNKVCDMLDVLLTGITVEAIKEDHMLRDHLRNSIRQIEAIMPQ